MFKYCEYKPENRYFMLIGRSPDLMDEGFNVPSYFSFINVIERSNLSKEGFDKFVEASSIYLELYPKLRLMPITRARFEREAARSQEMS